MSTIKKGNRVKLYHKKFQNTDRKSPGFPYVVQIEDTLSSISFREYGEVKYWPFIWFHNLYPYHLFQASILSPILIYPGTTIYLPSYKEIKEWYDNENEDFLDRFRLIFILRTIRIKPVYKMNDILQEKKMDVSSPEYSKATQNSVLILPANKMRTRSSIISKSNIIDLNYKKRDSINAPKNTLPVNDTNSAVTNPKFTIDLGNLQIQTPSFTTSYGTIHIVCNINSGKLILQRPGNYPISSSFDINKKSFDLELKLEAQGILEKFLKEIKLEFNGNLLSPKGEINFGLFKLSIDKNGIPSIGKSFEHSIMGLKLKIDLNLAPPVGNIFTFAGSVYIDRKFGSCNYMGLDYEGTIENVGAELCITYQNEGNNNSQPKMILNLIRASELVKEIQNGYRPMPKPGEKIFNIPKKPRNKTKTKKIPKGGVIITPPNLINRNVILQATRS
jgi:hypothetical protein